MPENFLKGSAALTIPANTKASLLIDQQLLPTAYPYLIASGGKGSEITLTYGETLFTEKKKKDNRNKTEGLEIWGNSDRFLPDGGAKRQFKPLWWRTFRYVQVDVQTKEEPLVIDDLYSEFTAYPFQEKATFASDNNSLKDIWNVGWRTARLCANETYMDCPFYEQLQYVGDTRIQSLISLYVSGDDRLMRQALTAMNNSRVPSGLTQSRYPSDLPQFIPNFSLLWVAMINDYWMHRQDDAFVKQFLPGIRNVLDWYETKLNQDNMIENLPFWQVIDHPYQAKQILVAGSQSMSMTGSSLMYALALDKASELFSYYGKNHEAEEYRAKSKALKETIYKLTYDSGKQMLADTPDKLSFSQHANILAILLDVVPQDQQAALVERITNDKDIIQASTYFQFYLFRAMKKAGRGDMFLPALQPWRNMLTNGLTTFAEWEVQPRSDCHAWSASPVYEMLATICGVEPTKPGFKEVRIAPALGTLKTAEGVIPHPAGEIKVKLKRKGDRGIEADISLPASVTGEFSWNGKIVALREGNQKIKL